jgi:hypothetical protein
MAGKFGTNVAQTSAAACTSCVFDFDFARFAGSSSCIAVRTCPAGTYKSVPPTLTSDQQCYMCIEGESYADKPNLMACKPVTNCDLTTSFVSVPATLTSDLVCTKLGFCPVGTHYETQPLTATTQRECGKCDVCDAGYLRVLCNDGKRNAICAECPPGYFSATQNAIVCTPWKECPKFYREFSTPSVSSDRDCAPIDFSAIELTNKTVAAMVMKLVTVDLSSRVQGLFGVLPFLFAVSEEPDGSYVVGTTVFLLYPVKGIFSFVATVYDGAGRAFNSRVVVEVHAPLLLSMESKTYLSVVQCYRDSPCQAPSIYASGGWPPLSIVLTSVVPSGLVFDNGTFLGTVTEPDGIKVLSLVVSDAQGYTLAETGFMQVSAHPPSFIQPQSSTSSSGSLVRIIGGAAGGGLALVILIAFLIIRSRRDTSINGIMVVKNPMFLPQATLVKFEEQEADEFDDDVGIFATSTESYLNIGAATSFNDDDNASVESNFESSTMPFGFHGETETADKSYYAFAESGFSNSATGTADKSHNTLASTGDEILLGNAKDVLEETENSCVDHVKHAAAHRPADDWMLALFSAVLVPGVCFSSEKPSDGEIENALSNSSFPVLTALDTIENSHLNLAVSPTGSAADPSQKFGFFDE